jgi:hypothetical protein
MNSLKINKMNKILKFIIGILFPAIMFSSMFSSCNYLNIDSYIDEEIKLDSIFATKRYIEAYMWDAAIRFPDEGDIFAGTAMYTPGPMATDEAFCLFGTGAGSGTNGFQGMGYVVGEYNADNLGYFNRWKSYYQIIRQCNTIFARIDEAHDWTATEKLRIMGYTRFIRAYAYYNLLVNWGPLVLLGDELPNNNEAMEYYDRPRDLYDECVEYICTEFEEAAKYMPDKVSSMMEFGRPAKGAAYALVARLRLMHASPLYNGEQSARIYFSNWTRKTDGKHYIAQVADPKRWAVAAAAAKRVMDMTIDGAPAYKLHTIEADDATPLLPAIVADPDYHKPFPNGAADIDPYRSYSEMFNGETVMNVNPEFIWARKSPNLAGYTRHSFPTSHAGYNGMCVTQKIVDAYEMADGRTISAFSDDYPYSESGFTTTQTSFSGYRLNAGVFNMYVNREMRFYASIGFSECFWPCTSASETTNKNLTVTYYFDSPNGKGDIKNSNLHPVTGYVIKKYINPLDAWIGTNARVLEKAFPIIRYAEILLSYAEALNNLGSESYNIEIDGVSQNFSRNTAEIKKAINQVRYRSGLPGLTDAEVGDYDFVLKKIKKERMVEFLYENQRYFDVRRWGDYEASENETIKGMNTAAPKEAYYQRVVPSSLRITNRLVNRRFIFLPIPKTELKRIPSFDQNPGW